MTSLSCTRLNPTETALQHSELQVSQSFSLTLSSLLASSFRNSVSQRIIKQIFTTLKQGDVCVLDFYFQQTRIQLQYRFIFSSSVSSTYSYVAIATETLTCIQLFLFHTNKKKNVTSKLLVIYKANRGTNLNSLHGNKRPTFQISKKLNVYIWIRIT